MTPAISSEFIVKSRSNSDVDSCGNSVNAMTPAEVMGSESMKGRDVWVQLLGLNVVRSD